MGAGVKSLHFGTVEEFLFFVLCYVFVFWPGSLPFGGWPGGWADILRKGGGGVIRDTPLSSKLFKEQAPLNQYVSVWTTGIMEASGYKKCKSLAMLPSLL